MPLVIEYRQFALPDAPPGVASEAVAPSEAVRPSPFARLTGHRGFRAGALFATAALAIFGGFGWDGASLRPAAALASAPRLLPFETAGENFPGSAFYFLDSDSGVVTAGKAAPARTADGAIDDERPAPLDSQLGPERLGAIARPTYLAGTAQDQNRALQCLTTAIYYEAASEADAGQRAVAQVVLNRVAHPLWPNSVCGVVYQGSERPGCQFSFACDGSMARAPVRMWWDRARSVAARALAGDVYAPVGLATYYHTGAVNPVWAARQTFIGAIGAHLFYRPPGGIGGTAAFTDRYWGGEPTPAPRTRLSPPSLLQADPLAVAQSWAAAQSPVTASPARTAILAVETRPLPAFTPAPGDALPTSGQIRTEYRDSGRWIASPKG